VTLLTMIEPSAVSLHYSSASELADIVEDITTLQSNDSLFRNMLSEHLLPSNVFQENEKYGVEL
jgi:hypothetical protein